MTMVIEVLEELISEGYTAIGDAIEGVGGDDDE